MPPIVTPALFDAVQEKLTANRNGAEVRRAASGALLIGRIFDDRGNRMTPSTAKKGSIRYRYYVSSVLAQGRKSEAGAIARVSASEIEAVVVDALRAAYPDDADLDDRALIEARVERIVLRAGSILIHPSSDPAEPIEVAWSPASAAAGVRSSAARRHERHERGIKAEARTVLLRSIALGRRWLDEVLAGTTSMRSRCARAAPNATSPTLSRWPSLPRTSFARSSMLVCRAGSAQGIAEPELEWSRQWNTLGISVRPASLA